MSSRAQAVAVVVAAVVVAVVIGAWALVVEPAKNRATVESARATAPAVVSTAAPTPTPVRPRVVFTGDSYTAGALSSTPERRWTSVLSRELGWEEVNLGQGGSGFAGDGGIMDGKRRPSYPEMVPQVAAADPDIVVVSTAGNDLPRGASVFAPAVADYFAKLDAALSDDVKIVVLSPLWRGSMADPGVPELAGALSAGAKHTTGATYLDLGGKFGQAAPSGLLGSDNVHPNDDGHRFIAEAVADAYRKAPAN